MTRPESHRLTAIPVAPPIALPNNEPLRAKAADSNQAEGLISSVSGVIHPIHEVAALRREGDPFRCDSSSEGRRAAMRMFAGLDVGFKQTAVCVVDEAGRIVWRGVVDRHPEKLVGALQAWG